MPQEEHQQLLSKLAEIKQDVSEKFGDIKKDVAINTVKTTGIESTVADIKSELKDIRLSFVTHSEHQVTYQNIEKASIDRENRIRVLENFKSVIFGGLVLSNVVIVPILIWLVIKQFN